MKNIKFSQFIFYLLLLISACNNSNNDITIPENLEANLEAEAIGVTTKEGDYGIVNLSLSKVLSKQATIKISLDQTIIGGANDADFDKSVQYSIDEGAVWKEAEENKIILPQGQKNFKVRIKTIDDTIHELLHETVKITFANEDTQLKLNTDNAAVTINILDDEDPQGTGGELMELSFDGENTSIVAVVNTISLPEPQIQKKIIDEVYKNLEADIKLLNTFVPAGLGVKHLKLLYSSNGVGGLVENLKAPQNETDFSMTLNMQIAMHNTGNPPIFPTTPASLASGRQDYNADGLFGHTMIHEFGHIITLASPSQAKVLDVTNPCDGYFDPLAQLCFAQGTYLGDFYKDFYGNSPTYTPKEPQFVSTYARSNISEDVAESFASYIIVDTLPTITAESSTKDRKIMFFDQTLFKRIRAAVRGKINLTLPKERPIIPSTSMHEHADAPLKSFCGYATSHIEEKL